MYSSFHFFWHSVWAYTSKLNDRSDDDLGVRLNLRTKCDMPFLVLSSQKRNHLREFGCNYFHKSSEVKKKHLESQSVWQRVDFDRPLVRSVRIRGYSKTFSVKTSVRSDLCSNSGEAASDKREEEWRCPINGINQLFNCSPEPASRARTDIVEACGLAGDAMDALQLEHRCSMLPC